MKDIFHCIYHPKIVDLVLAIKEGADYTAIIHKKINVTYSHTGTICSILADFGIISKQKVGRINKIKLTEKGTELINHLNNIKTILVKQTSKKAKS